LGRQVTGNANHDLPLFFALPAVFPAALAHEPLFTRALGETYEALGAQGSLASVTAAAASEAGTAQK
jgi:hypothetical protein